jgi:chromosome segregation ATPase
MSTAGKVLTIVVALGLLAWIVMFSLITDLNKNWAAHIQKLTNDLEAVKKDVADREDKFDKLITDIRLSQAKTDKEFNRVRIHVSRVEYLRSQAEENRERLRNQVASVKAVEKNSADTNEFRLKEQQESQQQLAAARQKVMNLQSVVGNLMDELGSLRDDFKKLLAENKQLLDRLENRSTRSGRIRAASLVR